jgi:Putative auto-transporter adhesin, head GIN domain
MFMKKIFLFAFTSLLSVSLLAQDKVINDANAEVRNVIGFHGIKVSHGIELVIKQGNAEAVAVSASEKQYRDRIKTEVVNGILKIYYENEKWYKAWSTNGKRLKAYVSFKQLDLVDGSSGSSTTIEGTMNAGYLKIDLSSGAGFSGSVQANRLTVDESSGATAHINGKAQAVSVETSSGAGFYGYDLISDNCDADASSGGSIEINVSKELSADASSGGDIRYRGNGVITKISTSSGGSVKSSR